MRVYITKENLHTVKDRQILKCINHKGIDLSEKFNVIAIEHFISDAAAEICSTSKRQLSFRGVTSKLKPDKRTKFVDVVNSYFKYYYEK